MSADPAAVAANAAVVAATATVQALSESLHSTAFPQHKLALPSFWLEDPAGYSFLDKTPKGDGLAICPFKEGARWAWILVAPVSTKYLSLVNSSV